MQTSNVSTMHFIATPIFSFAKVLAEPETFCYPSSVSVNISKRLIDRRFSISLSLNARDKRKKQKESWISPRILIESVYLVPQVENANSLSFRINRIVKFSETVVLPTGRSSLLLPSHFLKVDFTTWSFRFPYPSSASSLLAVNMAER